eukprot:Skav230355  [mRNA]  locus=scaffold1251:68287:71583:+ [translate_table: standard]
MAQGYKSSKSWRSDLDKVQHRKRMPPLVSECTAQSHYSSRRDCFESSERIQQQTLVLVTRAVLEDSSECSHWILLQNQLESFEQSPEESVPLSKRRGL